MGRIKQSPQTQCTNPHWNSTCATGTTPAYNRTITQMQKLMFLAPGLGWTLDYKASETTFLKKILAIRTFPGHCRARLTNCFLWEGSPWKLVKHIKKREEIVKVKKESQWNQSISTLREAAVHMQSQPGTLDDWAFQGHTWHLQTLAGQKAANPKCIPQDTPTSHRATAPPKQWLLCRD